MADASALVEFLLRAPTFSSLDAVITEPDVDLHVPALCDVEAASALRGLSRAAVLTDRRRSEALLDYLALPLTRHGHTALLSRMLELRDNFSAYDATYVALAEALGAALLSADEGLRRAAARHTDLTVLPPA